MSYVDLACRALIAIVFAVAAFSKIRSRTAFSSFASSLAEFGWLPDRLHRGIAMLVVATEIAVVALIATPATVFAGFGLAALTLALFTVSSAVAIRAGRKVKCQCFGTDGSEMGPSQLVRNGLLLLVCFAGLATSTVLSPTEIILSGQMLAVVTGAAIGMAITRWDDLAFAFGRG